MPRPTPRPSAPAASSGASTEGVDDGTKLTLWTRAPLEKQAKLLVEAYNASHKNQVDLTVVPNDDYVAKVGAAAGANGLPDLFAADIVYVPELGSAGPVPGPHQPTSTPCRSRTPSTRVTSMPAPPTSKEHVLPFVLDLSMLFWNKDLFKEAGLDPEKAPATMAEFADAAKKVQALNKPDTYGTATGLNCGGCLVFTWFPSHLGRRRPGHERRGHRVPAQQRRVPRASTTPGADLWASGAVLPSSKDEAGPTWTAGFTEGKVGVMIYPATLLSSTPFDVGVAGIPGPEGGARPPSSVATASASPRTPEVPAQAWNFLSVDDVRGRPGRGPGQGQGRGLPRATSPTTSTPPRTRAWSPSTRSPAKGETPVALQLPAGVQRARQPVADAGAQRRCSSRPNTVDADNEEITAVLGQ